NTLVCARRAARPAIPVYLHGTQRERAKAVPVLLEPIAGHGLQCIPLTVSEASAEEGSGAGPSASGTGVCCPRRAGCKPAHGWRPCLRGRAVQAGAEGTGQGSSGLFA